MSGENRFLCPNCGADIKTNATGCYNCGSDNETGWSENTYLDGVELSCDDEEYEELRDSEFNHSRKKTHNWVTITGFVLIVVFVFLIFKM